MLLKLQAILLIPEKDDEPVKLFHTSLQDYLCSEWRSKELCITMQQSHGVLAIKCLQLVVKYSGRDDDSKNEEIAIYACKYWLHHLDQSLKNAQNQDLLNDPILDSALACFTSQSVIYWWEKTDTDLDMEILEAILEHKGMPMNVKNIFEDFHMLLKYINSWHSDLITRRDLLYDGGEFRDAALNENATVSINHLFQNNHTHLIYLFSNYNLGGAMLLHSVGCNILFSCFLSLIYYHVSDSTEKDYHEWDNVCGTDEVEWNEVQELMDWWSVIYVSVVFLKHEFHTSDKGFVSTYKVWSAINIIPCTVLMVISDGMTHV
ncbi:hypothetical protein BDQ12DRAFT_671668 [Crucibulum laeve]|uniref:Uncharacterized protein n=1 Tax=Crucibulum laeve TaxID=68775 RepID=A0A5C3LG59_9AGAR|nr:hypothetical protein BDQ12DRAFT_671668 [Crucibulum laeve]